MKSILKFIFVFTVALGFYSCGDSTSEKTDANQSSPELNGLETSQIVDSENLKVDKSNNTHEISARDIVRVSVPFSIVDPFHGYKTNQIPVYVTNVQVILKNDGSVSATRVRTQYGWSRQGSIMDSVVYKDEFKGRWLKTERLASPRQTVYQISLDNSGYVWYWPENDNKMFARSCDNWEDMINNNQNKAYDVIKF